MKSTGRLITILVCVAIVSAGVSFALGATVFRGTRTSTILLEPTIRPIAIPAALMSGADDAAVTIIEVSDFECGYCRKVQPLVERLKEELDGGVRHAFIPFPRGRAAHKAVYGAGCVVAMNRGKGAQFRAALFDRDLATGTRDKDERRREAMEAVLSVAEEIGLDPEAFRSDIDAGAAETTWRKAVEEVDAAGLRATPTLFINGYRLRGALGMDGYRRVIAAIVEG